MNAASLPKSVDEYIATYPPQIQVILKKVRSVIRKTAPAATESISYRMPAYRLNGSLVYFAAFKAHLGLFPPVRGDKALLRAVKPYANKKGNLKFIFDQPIPYPLIKRVVKQRVAENAARFESRKRPSSNVRR